MCSIIIAFFLIFDNCNSWSNWFPTRFPLQWANWQESRHAEFISASPRHAELVSASLIIFMWPCSLLLYRDKTKDPETSLCWACRSIRDDGTFPISPLSRSLSLSKRHLCSIPKQSALFTYPSTLLRERFQLALFHAPIFTSIGARTWFLYAAPFLRL